MGRHVATGKCLFAKVIFKNKEPDTEIYSCLKVNRRKIIYDYTEVRCFCASLYNYFFCQFKYFKEPH